MKKTDGTILIISHQERILEIADRIIVINDGLVEKSGKEKMLFLNSFINQVCARS